MNDHDKRRTFKEMRINLDRLHAFASGTISTLPEHSWERTQGALDDLFNTLNLQITLLEKSLYAANTAEGKS